MTTILVVDDTPSELELICNYLRREGYTVVHASDATEALAKAQECKPNAIVTDVVMPGKSGYELVRSLKKLPALEKVPVVVCTSKNQEIDKLWAMKQGADGYVPKPFTKDELIRAVKTVAA